MNSSEKNYHFKQLIQLKVGVGPESESDDGTSDSTALVESARKNGCRQFMQRKNITDGRSVENISDKGLRIEVQPVQTNG